MTLTAVADTGFQFAGWGGDCAGLELACTVTMDAARSVVASFVDDTPPTPSIETPTRLEGPVVATFDEPVHRVSTSNFVLRRQDGRPGLGLMP